MHVSKLEYENAKLRMKVKLRNWFPGECEFLELVGYGNNDNRLGLSETLDWMVCRTCNIPILWV